MWTKDLVFEVLIRERAGEDFVSIVREIVGREPVVEDMKSFIDKVMLMYGGWVQQNKNIRKLGTQKPKTENKWKCLSPVTCRDCNGSGVVGKDGEACNCARYRTAGFENCGKCANCLACAESFRPRSPT